MVAILNQKILVFQSTLPREERRLQNTRYPPPVLYFNPRSHERSDGKEVKKMKSAIYISIHAPTRGATLLKQTIYKVMDFNPRSHERSDLCGYAAKGSSQISIHAPTRGATTVVFVS